MILNKIESNSELEKPDPIPVLQASRRGSDKNCLLIIEKKGSKMGRVEKGAPLSRRLRHAAREDQLRATAEAA